MFVRLDLQGFPTSLQLICYFFSFAISVEHKEVVINELLSPL